MPRYYVLFQSSMPSLGLKPKGEGSRHTQAQSFYFEQKESYSMGMDSSYDRTYQYRIPGVG